jgi:hypothetical protein
MIQRTPAEPGTESDRQLAGTEEVEALPAADEPDAGTADPATLGFWAELRDAVSARTVVVVAGVLLLQLGFILSYVGAFHHPKPHHIPLAVVAPAPQAGQLAAQLNALPGSPVRATVVADEAAARERLRHNTSAAALVVDATGNTDTLLVSSAAGTSVQSAVQAVVERAEAAQQRGVRTVDVVPLQSGDGRGLTGFYLVLGWIVGGYLVAALLGVAKGARPATLRRALFRLGAVVPYALLSGLGGALIVGPVLGALTGHFWALAALGALLVFTAAAVTMALQVLFGVLGIGLTVLLFVVLGNPSAGGAYQPALLPPFWRAISAALPNGAATAAVRHIVYFDGYAVAGPILVIAGWALAGVVVALAAAAWWRRDPLRNA